MEPLRQVRTNRRSFIATFQRLPPEVLSDIATYCMEMGGSPARLNQICGSMRETFNGMKAVWSKICLMQKGGSVIKSDRYQVSPDWYLRKLLNGFSGLPHMLQRKLFGPPSPPSSSYASINHSRRRVFHPSTH